MWGFAGIWGNVEECGGMWRNVEEGVDFWGVTYFLKNKNKGERLFCDALKNPSGNPYNNNGHRPMKIHFWWH